MSFKEGLKNFLTNRYELAILGVGAAAAAVGVLMLMTSLKSDPDSEAQAARKKVADMRNRAVSVESQDMSTYAAAERIIKNPPSSPEVSDKTESFLASEMRIRCSNPGDPKARPAKPPCGKYIPGDFKTHPSCIFCGWKQEADKKENLDVDGDGIPDKKEIELGMDPKDPNDPNKDKDGDGYTNIEEIRAGTDLKDPKSHPEYLDCLKIAMPLKENYLPFTFLKANKIPSGWRLEFFDPMRRDDYGRIGATITATIGEEVADSGFIVKSYTQKSEKQEIKGTEGLTRPIDVSEVLIERKRDHKTVKAVIQPKKPKAGRRCQFVPVDLQATLVYNRNGEKKFQVETGSEIKLNLNTYKIIDIKVKEAGAAVTVENIETGKRRVMTEVIAAAAPAEDDQDAEEANFGSDNKSKDAKSAKAASSSTKNKSSHSGRSALEHRQKK